MGMWESQNRNKKKVKSKCRHVEVSNHDCEKVKVCKYRNDKAMCGSDNFETWECGKAKVKNENIGKKKSECGNLLMTKHKNGNVGKTKSNC